MVNSPSGWALQKIKKRRLELPRLGYRRKTPFPAFCSQGTRAVSAQMMDFQRNEGEPFLRGVA
jgi:hypothetical protein